MVPPGCFAVVMVRQWQQGWQQHRQWGLEEKMSLDLCRVLRWEVEANDLCRDRNGFVLIKDLLRLKQFKHATAESIRYVARRSLSHGRGPRFVLGTDALTIKAAYRKHRHGDQGYHTGHGGGDAYHGKQGGTSTTTGCDAQGAELHWEKYKSSEGRIWFYRTYAEGDLDTDEFFMGDDENSGWEPAEIDGKPARLHLVKGRYFIEPW